MKFNNKVVAGILVAVLLITVLAVNNHQSSSEETVKTETAVTANGIAGVSAAIELNGLYDEASVEAEIETMVAETEEGAAVEPSEWDDKLIVDVKTSLNIRKEADSESKAVGKMLKGCIATIISTDGEWVEIESGNVKGFIKAEYCLFGEEAEAYARKNGGYKAIATTDGLRVRKEASTEGKTLGKVDKGTKLSVDFDAEEVEGWVAVKYDGKEAYVFAEYVEVKLSMENGYTNKEYKAKLEEEAKNSGSSSTQKSSIAASTDDVTLLAALIQCEAGNQSKAGKLAVGAVVCNRIRSSKYPNSLYKVIFQSGQFGPAKSGKLERLLASGNIKSSCIEAAERALAGEDNVDGALHFKSKKSGADGIVIGAHVFY